MKISTKKIIDLIVKSGLSIGDISTKTGLSLATIRQLLDFEKPKINVQTQTFLQLVRGLKIEPNQII